MFLGGAPAPIRTMGLGKTYRSRHGDVCAVDALDLEVGAKF
jgi:hypothetical protein